MTAKSLIAAIIDSELDVQDIVKRSQLNADQLARRLNLVMRKLVAMRIAKKITPERARALFLEAYVLFNMVGHAEVSQDVLDHARASTDKILAEAKALGAELLKVPAIRKVDKMQREAERRGVAATEDPNGSK